MADTEDTTEDTKSKRSKMPLILGIVLALTGAGGGFYAVFSGLVLQTHTEAESAEADVPTHVKEMPDIAFVALDPLVIAYQGGGGPILHFRAELEVKSPYQAEVEKLTPRIIDVLNSYLRAVSIDDIRNNSALVRIRAQMLRRVQIVTGGDRVNDLLIMEFVLN